LRIEKVVGGMGEKLLTCRALVGRHWILAGIINCLCYMV